MKSSLPLLSLVFVFASCTTAYKSGQTPDDVYFSPVRPQTEYERSDDKEDRRTARRNEDEEDRRTARRNEDEERDDRYVRMKVRNRRWSTIDDDYYYDYSYHPVYVPTRNSSWNAWLSWNYNYNPYCCCNTTASAPVKVSGGPRRFNLGAYTPSNPNGNQGIKGYGTGSTYTKEGGSSSSSSSGSSGAGNILRGIFGGGSSGSSSGSSGNASRSSGSSSSSSGSSSSGSSGGSSRRF